MPRYTEETIRNMSTGKLRAEIEMVKADIREYDTGDWFPSLPEARAHAQEMLAALYEELERRK